MNRIKSSALAIQSVALLVVPFLESAHAEKIPDEVNEFLVERMMTEGYDARAGFVDNVLANQAGNDWEKVHEVMAFLRGTLLKDAPPVHKRDKIYPRLMTFSGLEGQPSAASFGANDVSLMGVLLPNDLMARFQGREPVTIFALTNLSIAEPGRHLRDLLERRSYEEIAALMEHHVVEGAISEADLESVDQVKVLSGATLPVERNKNGLFIDGAKVVRTIVTSNGVIHVIDRPLQSEPALKRERGD